MPEVYCLTSPSGRKYIGVTRRTAADRFKEHCYEARRGRKNIPILSALSKYGPESFQVDVLAKCENVDLAFQLEADLIAELNTIAPNGYNATTGGDGVKALSGEALEYRKKRQREGMNTPESRAKRSEIGKKNGAKTSAALKERWADPAWRKSTLEKIRASAKRRTKPKPVKKTRDQLALEHSERMKKIWADNPTFSPGRSGQSMTDEEKELRRRFMLDDWANPDRRAARMKNRRGGRPRK